MHNCVVTSLAQFCQLETNSQHMCACTDQCTLKLLKLCAGSSNYCQHLWSQHIHPCMSCHDGKFISPLNMSSHHMVCMLSGFSLARHLRMVRSDECRTQLPPSVNTGAIQCVDAHLKCVSNHLVTKQPLGKALAETHCHFCQAAQTLSIHTSKKKNKCCG